MLRLVPPPGSGQEKRRSSKPACLSLTEDESDRLRVVLKNLHRTFRTWAELARAMGVSENVLCRISTGRTRGSPGIMIRAARVAGVPVERVLSAALRVANTCPTCGRSP
jgi:transcriptional regulator with XRE-family HTH domain